MDQRELEYQLDRRAIARKCKDQAITKMLRDQYIEMYTRELDNKEYEDNYDPLLAELQRVYSENAKARKHKVNHTYYFVSVSPRPGTGVEPLLKKIQKLAKKRSIEGTMYCIEWNKNQEPHCHILVHQLQCSDTDFRKNTKNTFKNLVDNTRCINIRGVPEDWIEEKKEYIRGEKWDTEKDEMIEYDRYKREQLGLEPYYCTGTLARPLLDEGQPQDV